MSGETGEPAPGASPPISASVRTMPQDALLQRGVFMPPLVAGTIGKLDRFEILRLIGEGAMGQVYLAREPLTGAQVAIKVMKPQDVDDPQAVHRFLTEARHMYQLSHPRILRVLEVSDRKEGPYYVTPFISGGNLLKQYAPGKPMPRDRILTIAWQVAVALAYSHSRGIIHRDLKPGNVLLDAQDNSYLTDFGLVRTVFNDSIVDPSASHLEGTAPYMSPAVARGEAEDTRCDIYAFGALLYELLTGQPPYMGRTPQIILNQVLNGPPKPILEVNSKADPGLVKIAEGCLARELHNRYASMKDVVVDLDRIEQGQAPLGPFRQNRNPRWMQLAAAGVGLLAVTGLAVLAHHEYNSGPSRVVQRTPQEMPKASVPGKTTRAAPTLPPGLIAWWPGDGHADDIIGWRKGVSVNGANYAPGLVGKAFRVNGKDQYFRVPHHPSLAFPGAAEFSLETWVYRENAGLPFHVMGKRDIVNPNRHSYQMGYDRGDPEIPVGEWSHLVVTCSSKEYNHYTNGRLTRKGARAPGSEPSQEDLLIGRSGPYGGFAGLIDDLRIYNRVLSHDEVMALHAAGAANIPGRKTTTGAGPAGAAPGGVQAQVQTTPKLPAEPKPPLSPGTPSATPPQGEFSIRVANDTAQAGHQDLKRDGAFGFPQAEAQVLCDHLKLRVSAWNDARHLVVQAILWEDTSDTAGISGDGRPLNDWSALCLDLDADQKPTPGLDRNYLLNPSPYQPGLRYQTVVNEKSWTECDGSSKGRGALRHVATPAGNPVRVDTYVIPLDEIGRRPGTAIRLAYWASSTTPQFRLNSAGYTAACCPRCLPRANYHNLTLAARDAGFDPRQVPDGREDKPRLAKPVAPQPGAGGSTAGPKPASTAEGCPMETTKVLTTAQQPIQAKGVQTGDKNPAVRGAQPAPPVRAANTAQDTALLLQVGDPAPKLQQGRYVQGEPVTRFDAGTAYVVEFWATWCGPCRTAIPHLDDLQKKYKERGLVVIGQNVWERGTNIEVNVKYFVGQMGDKMTYRVALDDGEGNTGKMAESWMKAAGIRGIPCAFVVDRAGKIAWIGHPLSGLNEAVEKILAGTFDLEKAKEGQGGEASEAATTKTPLPVVPATPETKGPVSRSAGDVLPALATIITNKPAEPKLPDDSLLARFPLRDSFRDESGTKASIKAQRTSFVGGALYLNGTYEYSAPPNTGYSVTAAVPDLSYSRFAVALHFWPIDLNHGDVLFMGGRAYRWLGVVTGDKGALFVSANNGRQRFPLGVTVDARKWHHLVCSVDLERKTILVSYDGKRLPAIHLPTDFKLDVVGSSVDKSDRVLGFTDYSNGHVFHGFVGDLRIYGRALSEAEMPNRTE